jgi:uroporphyrin-III C-methyltransferase / precorrin-2 dehydrogenase / sirohydrochlorin ferrochelatase
MTAPTPGPTYPVNLDVSGRRVVVVGGGPVAARRAAGLLTAGARVDVVAPWLCEDLTAAAAEGRVRWISRDYAQGDLDGAWLVHTCTGDPDVDAAVAAAAERGRIWCVQAADANASAAWTPAVARTRDVTIAVNAGGDPRRAAAVRDAVALLLETGQLPVRGQRPPATGRGWVALVGGGPGDPGLITTRGRQLLAEADVVVVDRLAPRALLDELDPAVEVIEAGKAPHAHTLTQDEINSVLVERAAGGQRVVRLKGGDPFVLGRGFEELRACQRAGVSCEMVPGVTSAIAVPAAAGIPVTHRGISSQVTVLSGHDDDLDWAALALAAAGGTLVLLMAVARIELLASQLIGHGRPPTTPVAIVESGFSQRQRTTVGDLATIANRAADRGVQAPAVIVIGDVVGLLDT